MSRENTELLIAMAEALGDIRDQLVFIGGCATALLISDVATPPVRATLDVDAISAISSYPDYVRLGDVLRERGFRQPMEDGAPAYRWSFAGMKLDLMPVREEVLGFSNRWYDEAMRTAGSVELREGLSIRLVAPPAFVATKLEAFLDRGRGDYLSSHDLEDVLSVVDGRPELVTEMASASADLREFVAAVFRRLLEDEGFLNALPGIVIDGSPASRVAVVLERMRAMAG